MNQSRVLAVQRKWISCIDEYIYPASCGEPLGGPVQCIGSDSNKYHVDLMTLKASAAFQNRSKPG